MIYMASNSQINNNRTFKCIFSIQFDNKINLIIKIQLNSEVDLIKKDFKIKNKHVKTIKILWETTVGNFHVYGRPPKPWAVEMFSRGNNKHLEWILKDAMVGSALATLKAHKVAFYKRF